jgi:hypothetical protein
MVFSGPGQPEAEKKGGKVGNLATRSGFGPAPDLNECFT